MIDCNKAHELANSYIDGMLTDAECTEYEEHISVCDTCREEYDMLKKISADLSQMSAPLPKGFALRAHENITGKTKSTQKFVFPYRIATSVVAAVLMLAVVGKFGVYDIYKKVKDENQRVTTELTEGTLKEETTPKKEFVPQDTHKTTATKADNTADNKKDQAVLTETEVAAVVVSEEAEVSASEVIESVEDESSLPQAQLQEDIKTAEPETVATPMMARMVGGEDVPPAESGDRLGDEAVSDEATSDDGVKVDEAPATGLIPASVEIYNNGDASMEMFKKYLMTFLDSSNISETAEGITITIPAERYESVMASISANEYVRLATGGTPFDGTAVIHIK